MNSFLQTGIALADFIELSMYFLLAMIAFLSFRDSVHGWKKWLSRLLLASFGFYWILVMLSSKPLQTKTLATLLLMSSVSAQLIMRRRKLKSRG
jgi:uncharacterized membrane protein HdeD (DUF308 family)